MQHAKTFNWAWRALDRRCERFVASRAPWHPGSGDSSDWEPVR